MKNNQLSGRIKWQSPSNIALIKYWGKKGFQIPYNPSLSMTLSEARTETELIFTPKSDNREISLTYLFGGLPQSEFEKKVKSLMELLLPEMPFLADYHLEFRSWNSFPHSSGIASSASAMSALVLCLCSMEKILSGEPIPPSYDADFFRRASRLARLGSGSASRSLYGGYVIWGKTHHVPDSSDEYAIPMYFEVHPEFEQVSDTILIISSREKKVSSRAGHELMLNHPFAEPRYWQAEKNLIRIIEVLQKGDWTEFARITENEALTLHALMMTSNPGYLLLHPNTLIAIEKIVAFRDSSHVPLTFTLDAGPNIHLLYPKSSVHKVLPFIQEELANLCENQQIIYDRTGSGPIQIFGP